MTDLIRKSDALAECQHLASAYELTGETEKLAAAEACNLAIAALPAVTVGVKPLVWEEPCARNNHVHIARSIFGDYYVHIDGGQHSAWLEAHTKPYERSIGEVVGSVYAAQLLAQADYAQRILDALEPAAPDPDETTAAENVGILQARVESLMTDLAACRRELAKGGTDPAAIREAALRPSDELMEFLRSVGDFRLTDAMKEQIRAFVKGAAE